MKIPDLQQVVALNASIRESDEWFEEPDDLELGRLLLLAARGADILADVETLLSSRK